jgi:adenylate cyclase
MIEIERKFLPSTSFSLSEIEQHSTKKFQIQQGYISNDPARTVRVRLKGEKGFLTIKGVGNETNISRFEWEKEIEKHEAEALLNLCNSGIIKKTRYEVQQANHIFEIDVFEGQNQGLIIIEIELESENETFQKPHWLGEEVTLNHRYFNAYLSQNPYKGFHEAS